MGCPLRPSAVRGAGQFSSRNSSTARLNAAGQEDQPPVWQGAGDLLGVAAADHVAIAGDDERGHGERREVGRPELRLPDHQAEQLALWHGAPVELREDCAKPVAEHDGELHRRTDAARPEISAVEHQFADAHGIFQREQHRNVRAVAEAQQVRPREAECVHERGQIVGELRKRERSVAARRPAVAARIHRDGAKVRGKGAYLAVEVAAVLAVAVQEDQRLALAALDVVQHVRRS